MNDNQSPQSEQPPTPEVGSNAGGSGDSGLGAVTQVLGELRAALGDSAAEGGNGEENLGPKESDGEAATKVAATAPQEPKSTEDSQEPQPEQKTEGQQPESQEPEEPLPEPQENKSLKKEPVALQEQPEEPAKAGPESVKTVPDLELPETSGTGTKTSTEKPQEQTEDGETFSQKIFRFRKAVVATLVPLMAIAGFWMYFAKRPKTEKLSRGAALVQKAESKNTQAAEKSKEAPFPQKLQIPQGSCVWTELSKWVDSQYADAPSWKKLLMTNFLKNALRVNPPKDKDGNLIGNIGRIQPGSLDVSQAFNGIGNNSEWQIIGSAQTLTEYTGRINELGQPSMESQAKKAYIERVVSSQKSPEALQAARSQLQSKIEISEKVTQPQWQAVSPQQAFELIKLRGNWGQYHAFNRIVGQQQLKEVKTVEVGDKIKIAIQSEEIADGKPIPRKTVFVLVNEPLEAPKPLVQHQQKIQSRQKPLASQSRISRSETQTLQDTGNKISTDSFTVKPDNSSTAHQQVEQLKKAKGGQANTPTPSESLQKPVIVIPQPGSVQPSQPDQSQSNQSIISGSADKGVIVVPQPEELKSGQPQKVAAAPSFSYSWDKKKKPRNLWEILFD